MKEEKRNVKNGNWTYVGLSISSGTDYRGHCKDYLRPTQRLQTSTRDRDVGRWVLSR